MQWVCADRAGLLSPRVPLTARRTVGGNRRPQGGVDSLPIHPSMAVQLEAMLGGVIVEVAWCASPVRCATRRCSPGTRDQLASSVDEASRVRDSRPRIRRRRQARPAGERSESETLEVLGFKQRLQDVRLRTNSRRSTTRSGACHHSHIPSLKYLSAAWITSPVSYAALMWKVKSRPLWSDERSLIATRGDVAPTNSNARPPSP